MKTKLLRKIRRKYEVLKVVEPEGYFETEYQKFGYVYKLTGGWFVEYFRTKQDALDYILKLVRINCGRKEKGEYRKVWYNKNI